MIDHIMRIQLKTEIPEMHLKNKNTRYHHSRKNIFLIYSSKCSQKCLIKNICFVN